MLNYDMREAREGAINIRDMNSNILSSMIHYIYTREMADDWQDLDIQEMAEAADIYDLPGWMEEFLSALATTKKLSAEKVAEMIIAGSRYKYSNARKLMILARDKIRQRREITDEKSFILKLRWEHPMILIEILRDILRTDDD